MYKTKIGLLITMGLLLLGCREGGSGGIAAGGVTSALPPGTYHLSFAVATPTPADAPIIGVDLTVPLPKGVTVATTTDGTGRIPDSALALGSALQDTSLILGRYQASQNQARLSLTTAPGTAWSGEFARLAITIPTGVKVTEYALTQGVLAQLPACNIVGLTSSHDTVSLTSTVTTTLNLLKP